MVTLLDTNVFIRWRAGSRIPNSVRRLLNRRDTKLLISIVTALEIGLKAELELSARDEIIAIPSIAS